MNDFTLAKTSQLFSLMADPTRLKIILDLSNGKEFCVTDISKKANLSLSATSHQLRKLEFLGIVSKRRYGQEICYCINKKSGLTKKIIKLLKLIKC